MSYELFSFLVIGYPYLVLPKAKHQPYPSIAKYRQSPFSKNCFAKLKKLKSVVLAVNYNFPHYKSTHLIRSFYQQIFGQVMFCGDKNDTTQNLFEAPFNFNRKGYQGYMCLNLAMQLYPNFEGYFYTNDDVILNWWQIIDLDLTKIWLGAQFLPYKKYSHYIFGKMPSNPSWHWWRDVKADENCVQAFQKTELFAKTKEGLSVRMDEYMKNYFKISQGNKMCFVSWSDVFYVPKQFRNAYIALSKIWGDQSAFLETAVPTMLVFFMNTTARNYLQLDGDYYVSKTGYSNDYLEGKSFYEYYDFHKMFVHPFKFDRLSMGRANVNFFNTVVKRHSELFYNYCKETASQTTSKKILEHK